MTVSESEIVLNVGNLPLDLFNNIITGSRDNQIEVHYDDASYADGLQVTPSGGGQGGGTTSLPGQIRWKSGTSTTGGVLAVTLDYVRYRPRHESYFSWTFCFPTGPIVGAQQEIGAGDLVNGVTIGYDETGAFGLFYRNNSVKTFIPRSAWADQCDGSPGSAYTLDGVPVAMDPSQMQIGSVYMGLLGSLGFVVTLFTPDRHEVVIHEHKAVNNTALPFVANYDLPMMTRIAKTTPIATDVQIGTGCWAGGTTSSKARISDPINDRLLAETTRTILFGKSSQGGGTYYAVKVTPSGAVVVDGTVSVSNFPAQYPIPAAQVADLKVVTVENADFPDSGAHTLLAAIQAVLQGTLLVNDGHPDPQQDALTETQLRSAPVTTREAGVIARAYQAVGIVTDQVLIPAAGGSLIIRKFHLHADPALASGVYPLVTLKLGPNIIFEDKFEAGLPYAEGIPIFGAPGESLTVSVSLPATIYLNVRHELA